MSIDANTKALRNAVANFSAATLEARFSIEATHRGEFLGMLPSGQRLSITGLTIFRFQDGQCVERWSETNLVSVVIHGAA